MKVVVAVGTFNSSFGFLTGLFPLKRCSGVVSSCLTSDFIGVSCMNCGLASASDIMSSFFS
jgi:hypothetical protein